MYKTDKTFLVGIAGGSGSGKTTLVQRLSAIIGPENLTLLHHDSYYKDQSMLTPEERSRVNYDHPETLETEMLIEHINLLKNGKSIEVPVYDFSTHCRASITETIHPCPLIIVEGILVLSDSRLLECFDLKIFLDLDADQLLARRIKRDTEERGRTVEASLKQYRDTTRPMFQKYVLPSRSNADIVISGDKSFDSPAVYSLGQGLKSMTYGQE